MTVDSDFLYFFLLWMFFSFVCVMFIDRELGETCGVNSPLSLLFISWEVRILFQQSQRTASEAPSPINYALRARHVLEWREKNNYLHIRFSPDTKTQIQFLLSGRKSLTFSVGVKRPLNCRNYNENTVQVWYYATLLKRIYVVI